MEGSLDPLRNFAEEVEDACLDRVLQGCLKAHRATGLASSLSWLEVVSGCDALLCACVAIGASALLKHQCPNFLFDPFQRVDLMVILLK